RPAMGVDDGGHRSERDRRMNVMTATTEPPHRPITPISSMMMAPALIGFSRPLVALGSSARAPVWNGLHDEADQDQRGHQAPAQQDQRRCRVPLVRLAQDRKSVV